MSMVLEGGEAFALSALSALKNLSERCDHGKQGRGYQG